ncbi:MAG: HlyD family type I secretion periplasmic adaptor subunit [Gammaproteobacteria bacterium]|nr:HlyD family type I secretion periplasmic adaptor subunit [Gammaproteobacteria bacterium]
MSPRARLAAVGALLREKVKRFILPDEQEKAAREADLELMPESTAAVFQGPPRYASMIIRGFVVFLVIALIWASFSRLEEITVGEGKVIPSAQVQVIQNLEGGIVASIPVRLGDIVKKGQIVLNLDKTRFASSMGEAQAKYDALLARIARLTAEVDGKSFQVPEELFLTNPGIAEEERQLYLNRQSELEATLTVLRQQANQRGQELQEKRTRLVQLQESLGLISRELEISKPLVAQGVLSEVEVLRLERQVSDLRGETDATRLALPRLEQSLAEARTKVEGQIAKFRSDSSAELNMARAEFEQTRASSVAMADRLERTSVRSPMDGIVKQIKITTVGGIIQPGMDVMEIVPIEDNLLIEARIRPSDIAFIHPGQEATVKFTAYDFSIYGGLDAIVENVTADSITDEKDESFFLVRVRTKTNNLGNGQRNLPIMPGMVATVHIRTGNKTVLNYLLKPVTKAKYDALRER